MSARASFKQGDVQRALNAVKAAGYPVSRVVLSEGRVEVIIGDAEASEPANPLDRLHAA